MPALYDRDLLRLAASIPHLGRLADPHGSAERRSPVCGSRVAADVRLDAAGRLADLGLEVKACALGQASASLLGRHALGRSAGELTAARDALAAFLRSERADAGSWPGLTIFQRARPFPARHAAILLAFEATAEAMTDAQSTRSYDATHSVRVERSRDIHSSEVENKSLGLARQDPSTDDRRSAVHPEPAEGLGTNGLGVGR